MEPAPRFRRLPLAFDAAALMGEVSRLPSEEWALHFNETYHNGGWSGIALRGTGGHSRTLFLDPARSGEVRDTGIASRCPQLAAAIAAFACPVRAARLLRLAPGGVIEEHVDPDLRFEDGEARLHVVLASHREVEFYLDGARIVMEPGECWYLDVSRPHRVANRGAGERIHLVIDVAVDDWLRAMIAEGDAPARDRCEPDGAGEFARFRELVHRNPVLAAQLRADTGSERFVARTVELGAAAGCRFAPDDVRAAMQEGRRRWLSNWTV